MRNSIFCLTLCLFCYKMKRGCIIGIQRAEGRLKTAVFGETKFVPSGYQLCERAVRTLGA